MSSSALPPSNASMGEVQSTESVAEALTDYQLSSSDESATDTCSIASNHTKILWHSRPGHVRSEKLNRIPSDQASDGDHASDGDQNLGETSLDPSVELPNEPAAKPETTSHSRRDLASGDWVIFAPERDLRPNDYTAAEDKTEYSDGTDATETHAVVDPDCPFCAGAEKTTPEAVWSAKLSNDPADAIGDRARLAQPQVEIALGEQSNWDIRVVPNKFPAVSLWEKDASDPVDHHPLFPVDDVVGGHEVIIESSNHAESITRMDASMVYLSLLAFRDRIRFWRNVPRIQFISVFKNCGPEAGASLRHSHCQLVATSLMPHRVRTTLLRAETHRARTGCSLGCDLLRQEMSESSRVIDQTDSFVAFCPFASRFPGLIRITTEKHQPHFDDFSDRSLDQLASFLWRALVWIDAVYPGRAYNYILQTCPPGAKSPEAFQWSLDLFPRLNKTAGFEWSSDCMINPLLPESAAENYRRIAAMSDPRRLLSVEK